MDAEAPAAASCLELVHDPRLDGSRPVHALPRGSGSSSSIGCSSCLGR
jgi:hypothetical protein